MEAFVSATIAGYRQALNDPDGAVSAMVESVPEMDPDLARRTFLAYGPLIGDAETLGSIDRESVADLSAFMVDQGLVPAPFEPDQFDATP